MCNQQVKSDASSICRSFKTLAEGLARETPAHCSKSGNRLLGQQGAGAVDVQGEAVGAWLVQIGEEMASDCLP